MQNLSQQLLYKLETHYDKIASMYSDGFHLEDIREHIGITDTDMQRIEEVMFNMSPFYTVKDIDGNEKVMQYNAYTLQSKEIKEDEY
jgi:hypothetical protein